MATFKPKKTNTRRNLKIAAVVFGVLVFLAILIYVSLTYLTSQVNLDNVTLDEFDEIPEIDTGIIETDNQSIDITDPVDPLTVAAAAEGTNEIELPGNDGPPEVDIPQHPYRLEQESS